ncbi:hypothetical protein JTE90_024056 [Oedothorax gibbosus]|uniref:DDE Tnp4 domain-containing protein n=1 Tax=Oedothorax gibbosus TaxID=931172 RepID=A0AAV6TLV1_9ARAC|nr:hypothetical protein JTE90_024056 [Oedothorax gibbosus]
MTVVLESWSDKVFKDNFRINRTTFDLICEKLGPLYIRNRCVREAVPVGRRLAITLAKLGSSGELRAIANLFGVARSTACTIINHTCKNIAVHFRQRIKFPRGDDLLEIADSFLGLGGLPGVVGAVDGTHIPIKAPSSNATEYYCRKGHYSVLLQGVADHKKSFTNVYFGWPGSVHDARVLFNSPLFGKCESREVLDQKVKLPGTDDWVDVYLVGDPAYPLKSWLMKPFPGHQLSVAEQAFNQRLGRNRVHIEHAFGFLKGRWRCLLKENDACLHNLQYQVMASCILHNICQELQDEFLYEWIEGVGLDTDDTAVSTAADSSDVRYLLVDWCAAN